jgi:hypothetical protein
MRTPGPDDRRRLIALLLARGEIGSASGAGDAGRERVDEPAEGVVGVDGEPEAPARFKRGDSVDRAA